MTLASEMPGKLTCRRIDSDWHTTIAPDEVEGFLEYLREIRYPYRSVFRGAEGCEFIFPTPKENLEEILFSYFDGIIDKILFTDECGREEDR